MSTLSLSRPLKQLNTLLIKPSGPDCNLDCTYCFYLQKSSLFPEHKVHRMNDMVLEAVVRQALESGSPQVNFVWQGGEPTLLGLDFYQRAVAFQRQYATAGQRVANSLQTNGLLLDVEWARFFKQHNFLIGLSLDGPQHVHDHYRITRGGQGSWSRVIEAARLLTREKVEFNGLTVVNDYSARFPEEIYDFHKRLGIRFMQFIPCVELAADGASAAGFSVTAAAYGDFLCRVFDKWKNDFKSGKPTTSVRWIDSVFHTYVGLSAPECTLLAECGGYVTVEHNGDVFSCDFYVEPGCHLGNVLRDDLLEMLNSPRQDEFGRAKKSKLPPECIECRWRPHCHGGCPKDRLRNPETHGSNQFCASYMQFFHHADDMLRKLATQWKAANNIKR